MHQGHTLHALLHRYQGTIGAQQVAEIVRTTAQRRPLWAPQQLVLGRGHQRPHGLATHIF